MANAVTGRLDAVDVVEPGADERAASALAQAGELAVDVEADSMHAFRARLCFVQVASDGHLFLFDTLAPGVSAAPLGPLFADPQRTKYFHAAGGDLQFLAEAGIRVKGLFDTHRAVTLLGWPKVGLADLARELLGVELAKEHQQADFSIRPLPEAMRAYIADDVRYLCEIGRRVKAACVQADILEEVLLDCERLSDDAAARPDLADYTPKLPRGGMKPAEFALAWALAIELHKLRLSWAEQADVPMGRMLSNAGLQSIVTRRPATQKELGRLEGIRGAFVREHGAQVLELVHAMTVKARAGELPVPEDARGDRDPKRRKRAEALKTYRAQKAAERKTTPSVVLPNAIVDELATNPPASVEALAKVPYFGAKRLSLYGAELVALLAG